MERHASAAGSIVPRVTQYPYYRAPPPYPRQSSSTPDLASPTKLGAIVTHGGLDARLSDLTHGAIQSQFDESLENLAAKVQQLEVYGARLVDAEYNRPRSDVSAVQLGQPGLDLHPADVKEVPVVCGHSASNGGTRNGDAHQLEFVQFNEYVFRVFWGGIF